jgi:hypothetical protein
MKLRPASIFGVVFAGWASSVSAQMADPPLTPSDRAVVQKCMDMYGVSRYNSESTEAIEAAKAQAKSYFSRIPKGTLTQTLVPIRKSLYRGTSAYTSVAFVLAYYGIDFEQNARRVVGSIALAGTPPAKLIATGFHETEFDRAGEWEAGDAVTTLYRHHHSAVLLQSYLRAPVDGAIAEGWNSYILDLFLAFPGDVLRASKSEQDMKKLAEAILGEDPPGDEHARVLKTIQRMRRSRNAELAALAQRFQNACVTQYSKFLRS